MLVSLATSKAGAALLIMVGALVSWAETTYHETLLKDNVSTLTILFAETVVFLAILGAWVFSSPRRVLRTSSDFYRITHNRWGMFVVFAVLGMAGAYAADLSLLAHGTHNMRMGNVIIGLGASSGLYMLSIDRASAFTSLPWLAGMVVCAVGLVNSQD